jgi:lipid-A-disaccharide synthase
VYRSADATSLVSFVGHYLVDDFHPATPLDRDQARDRLAIPHDAVVVGILPGSRRNEWATLTPVLLDAADRLSERDRSIRFVVAAAETIDDRALARIRERRGVAVQISRDSRTVMRGADLLLMSSGTATLEAALLGIPMVIAYKLSWITNLCVLAAIRLGLIESYRVGLPNLVLGRPVIPEALQRRATGPIVADEAWNLISSPDRLLEMRTALAGVGARLRGAHPIEEVADTVLSWADGRRTRIARASRFVRPTARRSLRHSEPD